MAVLAAVLVSLLAVAAPARASRILDPETTSHELALRGLEALHRGQHVLANRFLTQFIHESPDDPVGPLLRMKVSWWGILEGRDTTGALDRRLHGDLTRVQSISRKRLDRNRDDVRALFALGEAYCTVGRLHGIRGAGWATLQNHRKGTPLLERALQIDSTLVEPLASLGVFDYYASRAPGFLRFLARFFSVQADRHGGLKRLRRAATEPGIQQAEAAFFLLEILTNVEDEHLEALPFALRFHQRYPRNLGFAISLSSVQIGLERPEMAAHVLRGMVEDSDVARSVAGRFFLGRALVMTSRPYEAVAILEGFSPEDFRQVSWLRAWQSYYLGVAYEQLGRLDDAHRSYELTRATPVVADSHGYAERALERRPGRLQAALAAAEASVAWGEERRSSRARLERSLRSDPSVDEQTHRRAQYALGMLHLQEGDFAAAADALRALVDEGGGDDAWLVVRPRIRLLQALLWSGRLAEARSVARQLQLQLDDWGCNRHLALLVSTCLQTLTPEPGFEDVLQAGAGESMVRFELRDVGFTSVNLRLENGRVHAMRMRDGSWETEIPLRPGRHLYHFQVEGVLALPDPANLDFCDRDDIPWSVRTLAGES